MADLFLLALRRSAKSLWVAALFSLLFSLVFLLLYAADDVLEGVYGEVVDGSGQTSFTFTLKTQDVQRFSGTPLLAYSVEEGRDWNVEIAANGRSLVLPQPLRGISVAFADAAFDAACPDAFAAGRGFGGGTEGDIWLSAEAAVWLFSEEELPIGTELVWSAADLARALGQRVSVGGAEYAVAGVFSPAFARRIGAAAPTFAVLGGQAESYYAAVPAEGARAVFSLLQEGEYADDDGAVRLVRGFGLLSAGVSAVAVLGCAFAVLLAVRLFGAYFVSKERQNAVLRLCGAHRSGVFWLNWLVLAAAGALSLAVSVPLFYAWRAIVEALSSAIMGMQFGAPPPLAAYLGAGFAVYLAAAAAVCAVRAFSARVGREVRL